MTNTFVYQNAARAGKTHHGKIELREPRHPKASILVRPGYMVAANPKNPAKANRAQRRRPGTYRGFVAGAGYRRVRSLKSLGQHPSQTNPYVPEPDWAKGGYSPDGNSWVCPFGCGYGVSGLNAPADDDFEPDPVWEHLQQDHPDKTVAVDRSGQAVA